MCNKIHEEHTVPKKKKGKGWKLFRSNMRSGVLNSKYKHDENEWVNWDVNDPDIYNQGVGFCFFFNKKEAERACKIWYEATGIMLVVHQIHYKGVICRQIERCMVAPYPFDMGLCKSFRVIPKEVKNAKSTKKMEKKKS